MRALLLVVPALLAVSAPALAQREFVEEVDAAKKKNIVDVDLDAPDVAATSKKPPIDATKPDASKPDASKPDASKPDATKPDATKPDATKPDATKPDATKPDAKAGDPAEPAKVDGEVEGGVQVLETTYEAFLEKWDARASSVRRGEVARAKKQLPEIDGALLDFGVQGVRGGFQAPAAATALLREGRRALDDGSLDDAQSLVDTAEHAAPDLVEVHAQQALIKWKAGDLGGCVNALADSLRTYARDPVALSQLGARAVALLLVVVVLALAFFALLAGLPALRYLSFDLLQLLPRGAHGGQVLALVILAALTPLVVGAGPVFGALWILSLAWLYLQQRERIVVALLGVLCLGVPFALDYGARLVAYPNSRADRAWHALFDAGAEPLRRTLAQRKPEELVPIEAAAVALAAKREGRINESVARWQALAQKNPELAWAHADLGVAASLTADPQAEETALAELGKAVSIDTHSYAAAFDISVLHYRAGRTDKAQAAVGPLAREAPSLLNAYRRTTFRQPDQLVGQNRALVDAYPDSFELLRHAIVDAPTPESAAVADTVSRVLLRDLSGTSALPILAAAPLLWLILATARKKIAPSQPCVRCGDPASRRVDGKDIPDDTCGQCFHAFVSTRSRIDAGVKLRKEREIIRRRTRVGRLILVTGILWPGAGHIYGHAPSRGLIFAVLHTAGLIGLLFASGKLPSVRLEGPWSNTVALAVVGAFTAISWLVAVRSAFLLAQDASGRGRR